MQHDNDQENRKRVVDKIRLAVNNSKPTITSRWKATSWMKRRCSTLVLHQLPPVPLVLNRCRLRHTALVPQFFANRITRLHPRPHYLHFARRRKDCSPRRDHKRLRAPEPERVFHLRAEQQVDCSSFVCLCPCPAPAASMLAVSGSVARRTIAGRRGTWRRGPRIS